MWARCSTTERTPLVQVKEILKFYQWWNFPIFRGRWWHFLDWEVPRKVMTHYFWLNLQECVSSFFCEIKDIHRPADIYGGNGASWEAVPSLEKPLVRVREKPIYERFCLSNDFTFQYMTTFSNWSEFSHKIDTVEADWVMERLEELAPAAILGEQPFFMGWGLHRW